MIRVAVIGLVSVMIALQFKGYKSEYGLYIGLASGLVIIFFIMGKFQNIIDMVEKIEGYIKLNPTYINSMIKIIGISYIADMISSICDDAGFRTIGGQIEIFGKLSILALSLPIILALLETINGLL